MTDIAASLPSLFVVACPACGGWCAATAAMAGASACCPQCAAAFLVPRPTASQTPAPPVAAPATTPVPASTAPPVAAAVAPSPVASAAPTVSPEPGPQAAPVVMTSTLTSTHISSASAELQPTFEVPDHVHTPAEPAADMQFREPVKMVGRGPNAIELRRLTPEEKDARRRRRNIVILLTGAAILIAIAVVLGTDRRRR